MTESPSAEIREAIEAVNETFMAATRSGDVASVVALYTENGQVLPPNSDFLTGKEAIQKFWQGMGAMGIKGVTLETVEAEGHDDTAIEVGKYTLHGEEEQVLDKGKYIVIWKHEDGEWKIHRDIFNTSMPAPE